MQALEFENNISLVFTKVLNEIRLGFIEEEDESSYITDRTYWEKRASKHSLTYTDSLFELVKKISENLTLKYNKFYIGLAQDGVTNNFIRFRPKKEWVWIEPKIESTETIPEISELDVVDYDSRERRYRIRISKKDLEEKKEIISKLLKISYEENNQ